MYSVGTGVGKNWMGEVICMTGTSRMTIHGGPDTRHTVFTCLGECMKGGDSST